MDPLQLLQPLEAEIKGTKLKAHWDSGATITCVPQAFLEEEVPIKNIWIKTIHGEKEQPVYYLTFKIQGRKVEAEVISSPYDYILVSPSDIPWLMKKPLQLTTLVPLQEYEERLLKQTMLTGSYKEKLQSLFLKYDALWQHWENQVGHRRIKPHHIATGTVNPRPQKQYPINPKAKASIQTVINDLLKQGVLIQQNSIMNTPVYPVPKPDGKWRMVLDYREVNKTIPLIAAQNQHSAGILSSIFRGKYKTTLDLSNGFWAHSITPESYWLTAFTWLGQQYCWTRLPQGFLNSPALFTADVVDLLKEVPNVQVYVDDIYISHDDPREHLEQLEKVFSLLLNAGYVVSLKKSEIAQHEVEFLGFNITKEGRGLTETFKQKLLNITPPRDLKQLQSILGLLNFARNFIPNFSELVKPLYNIIATANGKYITWTTDNSQQLQNIISMLNSAENLEERNPEVRLIMKVNTSPSAGYIRFYNEFAKRPIMYLNYVYTKAEVKFTNTEKLLTTIHKGLIKALDLGMGQEILVYSPIVSMTKIQKTPLPERKALPIRWITWMSYLEDPRIQFHYDKTLPELQQVPTVTDDIIAKIKHPSEFSMVFYTDGSAIKHPNVNKSHNAGMGIAQVQFKPEFTVINTWSIPLGDHTAQLAEVAAVEFACKKALKIDGPVLIVTDSFYVAESVNKELPYWQSNGFFNNKKKPLKHVSKWKSIADCIQLKPDIIIIHEKGHQPTASTFHTEGNNLADKLATQGSYVVNINTTPSLDAELDQLLQGQYPKGFPKHYQYQLENGQVMVTRPNGKRIIPPKSDRPQIILQAHNIAHTGRDSTFLKVSSKYWWPNLRKDVVKVIRQCKQCLVTNAATLAAPPILRPERPVKPFDKFFIDYIGPLPPSNGYLHVLVVVDSMTGFVWLYPTKAPSTSATVKALNMLTSIAVPKVIHSDQGAAFTSATFADWAKNKGIQLEFSTPYHPQSSGKVERKNSDIKRLLTKLLVGRPAKWYDLLPVVQLALNNSYSPSSKYTPHQLLFGIDSNTPFANSDTLDLSREEELSLLQEIRSSLYLPSTPPASIRAWSPSVGQLVQERVARPASLRPRWHKPTPVLEVINPRAVVILDHLGNRRTVSVDNLKLTAYQKDGTPNESAAVVAMEKDE
ncbi:Pol precursor [African green monkey simian foamy virus]|uniref:Pro-Pol polyprotein n=2 Tax=Simiispumavirus TaxID=2169668 RepID=POL_SFV3L|nr:Pol precursor [African green monkey simian foamy virus]P27401.2 RecName: Full=Pro-Pol polyprotein; AltName: Full=Pr125Pol; Contains: RecName: Full=Protease/Reverse transcriptase/ribonuclease H; AltName: Full=p87Pro-RT-RNaseH; Contains: RecName: Full=Protease/Reverse transcriptase; AltName: Full=p65Pro-RT; Contains: RecName: Full=Ribonuclease H; Short=RNase H; Contains: RecName: Full=Integrase; Short=IN; AltName: Full=p42In [Simian foamy virus (TYPE 3 / STRAIN LK3)]